MLFPNFKSIYLDYFGSDHRLVLINTNPPLDIFSGTSGSLGPKSFYFEHKWLLEDDFRDTIKTNWDKELRNPDLCAKLDNLSLNLCIWAKDKVGAISNNIKATKKKLNRCLEGPITRHSVDEANRLNSLLEKLYYKEEIHWQQRSKNTWLAAGDRNTIYFHKTALKRRKRNNINSLLDRSGNTVTSQHEIEKVITDFYKDLFTTSNPREKDIIQITNHIAPLVNQETNTLTAPFTKEVKRISLILAHPRPWGPMDLPCFIKILGT